MGRLTLYLLDTNLSSNSPADQNITDQLYGGDLEYRIQQEIVLGIGGYRALQALGVEPYLFHMNEGHSALLSLERIRDLMTRHHISFMEAREAASAGLIFTTHTPVAAGHDFFPPDLMQRYFSDYATGLGISMPQFLGYGRTDPSPDPRNNEQFCMTPWQMRTTRDGKAVRARYGEVLRNIWYQIVTGVPVDEIPITHVTNGAHFRSWVSLEMEQLYDRFLGSRWQEEPADQKVWAKVARIPPEELWNCHERRREQLVAFARRRLREQLERRGATISELTAADEVLDSEAMTIGFARRFATYKRATLLLRDPDRLAKLLNNPERPVQIVFSGAAHPKDHQGKELIQQIVTLSRQERFRKRLVFLESYGISLTRYLIQGSDVWLNTPRRPQEASGTSGMKATANGVLNLSTLDGWWDEAWSGKGMGIEHPTGTDAQGDPIGWAIGRAESYDNPGYQDQVESAALYDLLERDVVPTFYDRGVNGVPRRWVMRMKASLGTLCHFFNTHRMVRDYTERFYVPSASLCTQLLEKDLARAKALAAWRKRVEENWKDVRAEVVHKGTPSELPVGGEVRVQARVRLGPLKPDEVEVQFYLGQVNADDEIVHGQATPMKALGSIEEEMQEAGCWLYQAAAPCVKSGLHGYTVRVLPRHPDLGAYFLPGLIAWAKS